MVALVQTGLRALQLLFTIIILGVIGNAIDEAFAGNPSSVNYSIFVAVFSFLVVLYGLLAAFMESLAIPVLLMALDGFATLFTFIAGVVLAAFLHVHSCGNKSYVLSNHMTNGSHNPTKRCHELQAGCAFFWFLFAAFVGSLVMDFTGSRGGMTSSRGGIRRGGPSMSQV